MTKLMWHNIGHREYKPGVDHGVLVVPGEVIEGVVVEQNCQEYWEWDEFSAWCELKIDGHTKHRWVYHDDYKGVDVVIEWESYWGELPETEWPCPDCEHMHKGKDENAENPNYYLNGSCKQDVPHWASGGTAKCSCARRRPDKEKM